jgi:hypothetical protein
MVGHVDRAAKKVGVMRWRGKGEHGEIHLAVPKQLAEEFKNGHY